MNTDPVGNGFPLNRIVAFFGPYIAIGSGILASWLLVHIHLLGLFHLQHDGLASAIAQGLTLLLVSLLTWAGQSKWLTGHHIAMTLAAQGTTAASTTVAAGEGATVSSAGPVVG
jgi:hypothetical protein